MKAAKPKFASLPDDATIDTVTLDQALVMLSLPRTLGETPEGQTVKTNIGRFGPYVQVDTTYASIKPPLDPFTITLEEGLQLYQEKLEYEANKYIARFDSGIDVMNGRWGPYITNGTKNAKIPQDTDPKTITEAQAQEMLEAAPAKGARRRTATATKKAAPRKKTATKKKAAPKKN
jgi:DNA topoisomerase-1